jgi:hypothetical protein
LKKKNEVVFYFEKIEVVFYFEKKLRLSFILKNIEVVFHISSNWVRIRLQTENQLPRLPRTALIVMTPGVVVVLFTDNKTTLG